MKNSLPGAAKVSKEAKECVQECVSEYISFIVSHRPFMEAPRALLEFGYRAGTQLEVYLKNADVPAD